MPEVLKRFVGFASVGIPGLGFELLMIWVLMTLLNLGKLPASIIAFYIAFTAAYFLMRRFSFYGSTRKMHTGYIFFIGIAVIGNFFISVSAVSISNIFEISIFIARPLVGCVTGIINFVINGLFNFKVF